MTFSVVLSTKWS